jgi:hypothetical protein
MYSYLLKFSVNFRLTSFMLWPGSGKSNDVIKGNACIKCTMTVTLKKPPTECPESLSGNKRGREQTNKHYGTVCGALGRLSATG